MKKGGKIGKREKRRRKKRRRRRRSEFQKEGRGRGRGGGEKGGICKERKEPFFKLAMNLVCGELGRVWEE